MADVSPLLSVIVGGVIALAGSCLGPLFLQGQKNLAKLQRRRANKFEGLVKAIYEFDYWLDTERNRALGGSTSEPTVSPFAKIQAIASLYFPQFDPLVRELDRSTAKYRLWIESTNFKRMSGQLSSLPEGLEEALGPYSDARDKLVEQLSKFAQLNLQEADAKVGPVSRS
jgi:hypothetical protein